MDFISEDFQNLFYRYGPGSLIMQKTDINCPEKVAIGRNVLILENSWFTVVHPGQGEPPAISIGDGCSCSRNLIITSANSVILEENVVVGPDVYIADTDHQYRQVGIPIRDQWITSTSQQVRIGAGSELGAHCVIVGEVTIGKGCRVTPNSVVTRDLPDFCIAAGNPAKVVDTFDPEAGLWQVSGEGSC
ncbi:acyltransferase [Paenibacillus sp. FSL H8-0048]|uniref:acyltransferase n=1 Tax=Paenibacillus sp. FSL H8-0048 TaxID=2954508 RepID=UPI0030FAE358